MNFRSIEKSWRINSASFEHCDAYRRVLWQGCARRSLSLPSWDCSLAPMAPPSLATLHSLPHLRPVPGPPEVNLVLPHTPFAERVAKFPLAFRRSPEMIIALYVHHLVRGNVLA